MCREQAHGWPAHPLLREGVGGDLLSAQLGQEVRDAPVAGVPLLDTLGRGEQREHSVEGSVGPTTGVAAAQRRRLEPLWPAGSAADRAPGPDRPQHLLGTSEVCDDRAGVVEESTKTPGCLQRHVRACITAE
ncbi:unannotated protein [freshwater metagenome]|uniref:Unannotated protein n=1 Tax=freshwater metagenome TaxID=449393 RepID=A0A6J7BRX0_9ZZZZ